MSTDADLVLVTGGSGFLGSYCIIELLKTGYRVRTTVRGLEKEKDVKEQVKAGEVPESAIDRLQFVAADLSKDEGWKDAVKDCSYVLHVASPFPSSIPKHEDDLITPAREGTLRILRAAREAHVKRVVLTSSFAAISHGQDQSKALDETAWSKTDCSDILPYPKSKTLAERAAWDFVEKEGGHLELSVINPVGIFGPVLGPKFASSIVLVQRLLNGDMPGLPQLTVGVVDVRDVADIHIRAMLNPLAKGQRFLAVAPPTMSMKEMADLLRERMPDQAKRVPTRILPNLLIRLYALIDQGAAMIKNDLGKRPRITNQKAKDLLNWNPRSNEEAFLATAESLIALGLVKS